MSLIHGDARDGKNKARLYRIWANMKCRCDNPKAAKFHLYGGKGIKICDQWRDYRKFREWALSSGYEESLMIDRKESNKDYEPNNCRWVTVKESARNVSHVHPITAFGETKLAGEWAEDPRCVVKQDTLRCRIFRYGWKPEEAIVRPAMQVEERFRSRAAA